MVLYVVESYKTKFQIRCAIIANILKTSSENHMVLGRGRVVMVFQRSLSFFFRCMKFPFFIVPLPGLKETICGNIQINFVTVTFLLLVIYKSVISHLFIEQYVIVLISRPPSDSEYNQRDNHNYLVDTYRHATYQ